MKCCNLSIIPFDGQAATVINYTADLKSRFGPVPSIDVYYREISGEHVKGEVAVNLDYPVTRIRIDHGGVSSGYVKISV
jgi:hypothetical protein